MDRLTQDIDTQESFFQNFDTLRAIPLEKSWETVARGVMCEIKSDSLAQAIVQQSTIGREYYELRKSMKYELQALKFGIKDLNFSYKKLIYIIISFSIVNLLILLKRRSKSIASM
jgi:hypothetical protein